MKTKTLMGIRKNWQLYLLLLVPLAYIVIFSYLPMVGSQIAFRKYMPTTGIWGSEWVGLRYFEQFITSSKFGEVIRNTLVISFYSILVGFPLPILFALSLNYVQGKRFKKSLQMISYAPNFISTVVMCGIIVQFLNPTYGLFNSIRGVFGLEPANYMANYGAFPHIYVWSGVWQGLGFSSIIYIAALSGVSPELHEAAIIDGATKLKRIWYIDLPSIIPTAIIILIMNTGQILNVGFEKVLLLQTPLNLRTSEIISTYTYKMGLIATLPNYSYATAIGLFQSLVGLVLLLIVNTVARRVSETSLW